MNKKWLFLTFGLFTLALANGCTSTTPTSTPKPATPTAQATQALPLPTPFAPGEQAAWQDLRIRMASAEITTQFVTEFGSERKPSPGQKFLWVHIYLENTGKNEIKLPASEHFSVLYTNSEFKPTYGHRQDYPDYMALTTPLYPAQGIDTWLRFDIPAMAELENLRFVFLPESAQVGVRPSSPGYPWGGEHPVYVWECKP